MEPLSKLALEYPIYALDIIDDRTIVVAGGGGRMKSGIPNACHVLNFDSSRSRLKESASIELPDAVVSLTSHQSTVYSVIGQGLKNFHYTPYNEKSKGILNPTSSRQHDLLVHSTQEQSAVAVSSDGSTLIIASDEGHVVSLKLPYYHLKYRGQLHTQGIIDLCISSDSSRVATTARDNTAYIWEACTGNVVQQIEPIMPASLRTHVRAIRFSPSDLDTIVTTESNPRKGGWIAVWNKPSKQQGGYTVTSSTKASNEALTALTINENASLIAISTAEGHISLFAWNRKSLSLVWSTDTRTSWFKSPQPPHVLPVTGMKFSSSNSYLFAASADYTVTVWPTSKPVNWKKIRSTAFWLISGFVLILSILLAEDNHLPQTLKQQRSKIQPYFDPHLSNLQSVSQLIVRKRRKQLQQYSSQVQQIMKPHVERIHQKGAPIFEQISHIRQRGEALLEPLSRKTDEKEATEKTPHSIETPDAVMKDTQPIVIPKETPTLDVIIETLQENEQKTQDSVILQSQVIDGYEAVTESKKLEESTEVINSDKQFVRDDSSRNVSLEISSTDEAPTTPTTELSQKERSENVNDVDDLSSSIESPSKHERGDEGETEEERSTPTATSAPDDEENIESLKELISDTSKNNEANESIKDETKQERPKIEMNNVKYVAPTDSENLKFIEENREHLYADIADNVATEERSEIQTDSENSEKHQEVNTKISHHEEKVDDSAVRKEEEAFQDDMQNTPIPDTTIQDVEDANVVAKEHIQKLSLQEANTLGRNDGDGVPDDERGVMQKNTSESPESPLTKENPSKEAFPFPEENIESLEPVIFSEEANPSESSVPLESTEVQKEADNDDKEDLSLPNSFYDDNSGNLESIYTINPIKEARVAISEDERTNNVFEPLEHVENVHKIRSNGDIVRTTILNDVCEKLSSAQSLFGRKSLRKSEELSFDDQVLVQKDSSDVTLKSDKVETEAIVGMQYSSKQSSAESVHEALQEDEENDISKNIQKRDQSIQDESFSENTNNETIEKGNLKNIVVTPEVDLYENDTINSEESRLSYENNNIKVEALMESSNPDDEEEQENEAESYLESMPQNKSESVEEIMNVVQPSAQPQSKVAAATPAVITDEYNVDSTERQNVSNDEDNDDDVTSAENLPLQEMTLEPRYTVENVEDESAVIDYDEDDFLPDISFEDSSNIFDPDNTTFPHEEL